MEVRKWRSTLLELEYGHKKIDHASEDAKDYRIKEYEIALKHDDTGAIVKLTDDGLIDVFAGPQTGIRIDPHTQSVNLFGNRVNVMANQFNIQTQPYGLNWNGKAVDPNQVEELMTKPKQKVRYSDGMVDIMKKLGLPAEYVDKEAE